MRRIAFACHALAMLALTSCPSFGEIAEQEPRESGAQVPNDKAATGLDTVTVEARRRRERISRQVTQYVGAVAGPVKHEALARWQVPICPVVVGLPVAEGDFVRKRVEQIATESGVPLLPPGCAANFVIVVTQEPEAFLREWWNADHGLFNKERGVAGVERMIRTPQPVRVWHNVCSAPPGMARNFRLSVTFECNSGTLGSRITWDSVRAIYSAIEVVDIALIEGLTYGQVADFVAITGLAKTRPNPQSGDAATILNLFTASGDDRPKALTVWDQAYLNSLYATIDGSRMEVSQIKLRMEQTLAPEAPRQ